MEINAIDLRSKMRDIVSALERNESVTLFYRGVKKGVIQPHRDAAVRKVEEHRFFGAGAASEDSVDEEMDRLRGKRY